MKTAFLLIASVFLYNYGHTQCPVVAISPSNPIICGSGNVTLTANPSGGTGSYVYLWNTGQTTQSIVVNTPGIYSVAVSDNSSCALATQSISVSSAPIPSPPVAGNSGPSCSLTPLNLSASNIPGATYDWTGPYLFTSTLQNPVINTIGISQAGDYSVTATVNGCTSLPAITTVVLIPAVITPPLAWYDKPACAGRALTLHAANYIGGSYTWSGPNGFVANTEDPVINNVAFQDSGTYNVVVAVNGCISQPGSVTVSITPTPNSPGAGNNGPLCAGATLNLNASTVTGASYNWTGPNSFASTNQNEVITNTMLTQGGLYSLTATVNGCTSNPATTDVVVNAPPPSPLTSNNGPLCVGQTLFLNAISFANSTYNWTGPNGFTSSIQSPAIPNVIIANAGTYNVTTTLNGCTSLPSTTTTIISPVVSAPLVTSNSPICSGSTLNLNTPSIAGVSYNWTGPNGFTSSLQNPVINNISVANGGLYNLTIIGCNSLNSAINVIVNPTPLAPTANNNGPVCIGQTVNLTAGTIAGATYKWTGPNGFTSINQNPVITNAPLTTSGMYNVMATLNACVSPAGSTTVIIGDSSVSNAGNNQTVCADVTSVNLNGSIAGGSTTGLWSTNGTGKFSPNNTSLNAIYFLSNSDKANGSVTFTLTSANNGACKASGSSLAVTILNAINVNAGQDLNICASDNNVNLNGQVTTSAGGTWSTTGTGTFTPSASILNNSYIPGAADKANKNVMLILTSTGNGSCKSISDTTILMISPGPVVNAGPDKFVLENETTTLEPVVAATNLLYLWTPNLYLNNSAIKNPVVTGINDQLYTLTVTDNLGCSNQDDVLVKVLKKPIIPNTFTPNNDGINDTWVITNLEGYANCRVQVFNRYGQLVFESKGYTKPWDGTLNGKSLPFGTFYYVIEPGSGRKPITGYVTIVK